MTDRRFKDLVEKGFLTPAKRGRPCLYSTDEERRTVRQAQQRVCMKRHNERLKEAKQRMLAAAEAAASTRTLASYVSADASSSIKTSHDQQKS